eukprot:TRINITY_DN104101_c0_g1_i1.p1 TRINITY_DN104101_c0_g1~~TRINITY_DN104101_c0_g1_i1.p1  ORF type:complete len:624 (-),score=156.79 TRINITY_DN104101_c0_g1_i1:256-2127(-)
MADVDVAVVLVWVLRLTVPIILFWISLGPKIRWPIWSRGPKYSREDLITWRSASSFEPAAEIASLRLVGDDEAPELFLRTIRRADGSLDVRDTRKRRPQARDVEDKPKKGQREREREKEQHKPDAALADFGDEAERPPNKRSEKKPAKGPSVSEPAEPKPMSPEEIRAMEVVNEREKARKAEEEESQQKASDRERVMHIESLVNFVAFNRYKQQRRFAVPEGEEPAPPPSRPPGSVPPKMDDLITSSWSARQERAERANAEAQMVLQGALVAEVRRVTVARGLFLQLVDLDVDIESNTFELMVEACVKAKDLPAASDFLMRMEGAGHSPGNDLLDRVMELYLVHKREEGANKNDDCSAKAPVGLGTYSSLLAPVPKNDAPPDPSELPTNVLPPNGTTSATQGAVAEGDEFASLRSTVVQSVVAMRQPRADATSSSMLDDAYGSAPVASAWGGPGTEVADGSYHAEGYHVDESAWAAELAASGGDLGAASRELNASAPEFVPGQGFAGGDSGYEMSLHERMAAAQMAAAAEVERKRAEAMTAPPPGGAGLMQLLRQRELQRLNKKTQVALPDDAPAFFIPDEFQKTDGGEDGQDGEEVSEDHGNSSNGVGGSTEQATDAGLDYQ